MFHMRKDWEPDCGRKWEVPVAAILALLSILPFYRP